MKIFPAMPPAQTADKSEAVCQSRAGQLFEQLLLMQTAAILTAAVFSHPAALIVSLSAAGLCFLRLTQVQRFILAACNIAALLSGINAFERNGGEFIRGSAIENGIFQITDKRLSYACNLPPMRAPLARCLADGREFPLLLPKSADPDKVRYGSLWRISGRTAPQNALPFISPQDGSEGELLPFRRGSGGILCFADSAVYLGCEETLWGKILSIRDALLRRALSNIPTGKDRALIAGIFFGVRTESAPADRLEFIRSGIIHLLSVSGYHVAMLAGLLLAILRPLGIMRRNILILLLIGIYVMTTGANPASVRAFCMISGFFLLQMFRLHIPALNILTLTAVIMLLASPENLGNMGFWYSFTLTAALLILADKCRTWHETLSSYDRIFGKQYAGRERLKSRAVLFCLFTLSGTLGAFAAALPLSLYFQGLFIPGSIPANLLLSLLSGILFPVLAIKILFGALFPQITAALLLIPVKMIGLIAGFFSVNFDAVSSIRPALWQVIIFYAAFLTAFLPGKLLRRICGGAVMLLLTVLWLTAPAREKSGAAIFSGGDLKAPMIIITDIPAGTALVLNMPYSGAELAEKHLADKGLHKIDELHFSVMNAANAAGIKRLSASLPVSGVYLPSGKNASKSFREKLALLPLSRTGSNPMLKVSGDGRKMPLYISYCNPNSKFAVEITSSGLPANCWRIKINGKEEVIPFPASNIALKLERTLPH